MRALRFERFGPSDQLQLQEIAIYELQPDEVLVEIRTAGLILVMSSMSLGTWNTPLNPSLVETEGMHTGGFIGSDFENFFVAQTPLGRIGQAGDIASIAVFLASDDAAWLTGELLIASGGLR